MATFTVDLKTRVNIPCYEEFYRLLPAAGFHHRTGRHKLKFHPVHSNHLYEWRSTPSQLAEMLRVIH